MLDRSLAANVYSIIGTSSRYWRLQQRGSSCTVLSYHSPMKEEFGMKRLMVTFKYARYAMGSMSAVLFAVCCGSS